ncbi:MAG TPA: hypothetical protein VGL38_15250 [bacterium]|jgi:hypothetical protein
MKKAWTVLAVGVALGMLVLAGCSKDESNPASSNDTDQSALSALMTDDSDLEAVNSWAGDDGDGGPSPLDSAVTPINWFRTGRRSRANVTVDIQGDTLATITRTATYNGTIRVVIDTAGGVRTVISKPMANTLTRKAHARRVGHGNRPRENWRIYEVTPEVLLSSAPNSNTVRPVHVQFYSAGEFVPTLIADITDPLNTWFRRDSLPEIRQGGVLEVSVTPNVTDTVAAFLHPHVWREARMHRQPMGRATDSSNTYWATFDVGQRLGVHMTAPDLLSRATLYTSDGAYDAGSWAIPYRVVAAQ